MERWLTPLFASYLSAPDEIAFDFYGVSGYTFKLGERAFEAVPENVAEGTHLWGIIENEGPWAGFSDTPLAVVRVRARKVSVDDLTLEPFYVLEDVSDGHLWLTIGDASLGQGSPLFQFLHTPKEPPAKVTVIDSLGNLRARMRVQGHKVPMEIAPDESRAIADMLGHDFDIRRGCR